MSKAPKSRKPLRKNRGACTSIVIRVRVGVAIFFGSSVSDRLSSPGVEVSRSTVTFASTIALGLAYRRKPSEACSGWAR